MSVQISQSPAKIQKASALPRGATKTDQMRSPKEAWLIIALLFLFMVINFADKAVIGIAAVPIMQELKLSPSQFGLIGSSFFCCFRCRRSLPALSSIGCRRAGRCWSWASSGR